MDEVMGEAIETGLVRSYGALPGSIEIVRYRQEGERATALARWTDARSARSRRGAVDLVATDAGWRTASGWSSGDGHDSRHPMWRSWGSSARSTSGWVADASAAAVRLRAPDGRIETDLVEDGAVVLMHATAPARASTLELLDDEGTVLHASPIEDDGDALRPR